jgi:hypothetical protein
VPAGKKNNQEPVEKPEPFFEWHKKETLYPFTLNLKTLTQQKLKDLKLNTLKDTFKVMLSTEITPHSPKMKTDNHASGEITAIIGMNGTVERNGKSEDFNGLIALSFTKDVN